MKYKILAVDDDETFLKSISKILTLNNFEVTTANTPYLSLELLEKSDYDALLTDVKMPGMNGIELQKKICEINPALPVVAISGQSNIPIAIEMLKNGTYDFLEKPVDDEKLIATLSKAIEHAKLIEEKNNLIQELETNYKIVGKSGAAKEIINKINIIAPTDARVLITGETGTGKELIAWALHHNSLRKNKSYIKLNCASIPGELLESELFGHKRGSFTGADKDRDGKFIAANNGTLFLDEIGDMSFNLQSKLLRVLEENEITVVGENSPKKIDVRIIAATNKNLSEEIRNGRFREDLFHRINVFEIYIPPLRERKEDILPLAYHFLKRYAETYNKRIHSISPQVEGILLNNNWKGNVRELRNMIEKLVIMCDGDEISIENYYSALGKNGNGATIDDSDSLKGAKEKFEKELLLKTLIDSGWKVSEAAEKLKIERTNLFKKMQKYNIKRKKL